MKDTILLHHSANKKPGNQIEGMRAYHSKKFGLKNKAAYHFVIEKSGEVIQEHDEPLAPPHAGEWNRRSIGIVLCGDFRHEDPTDAQMKTLTSLITGIQHRWGIQDSSIKLHREVRPTACPIIDLRQLFLDYRVLEDHRRLLRAISAVDRVSGGRRNRLVRFIERMRKLLGM